LGSFEFKVFVGYIIIGVGLGLFGPLHLAMSLKRKRELCASIKKARRKPASLESFIGFLALVVSKL